MLNWATLLILKTQALLFVVGAEDKYRSADFAAGEGDVRPRTSLWQQRASGLRGGSEGNLVVMASRSPRKPGASIVHKANPQQRDVGQEKMGGYKRLNSSVF